jgi:hypothetical protein
MHASSRPSDEQLRPYGFIPGNRAGAWCAACGRTFDQGMGPGAFKCRPCAEAQLHEVEKICRKAGYGED